MKKLLSLLLILTIAGCSRMTFITAKLDEGMEREKVITILGEPDGIKRKGDYEVLKYSNVRTFEMSRDRADYFVILKDDKVVQHGTGQIKIDKSTDTFTIVPVP